MKKRILIAAIIMLPTLAFAQANNIEGGLGQTLTQVGSILKFFLGIALPLAIAFFFWGLIQFIRNAENADLKKTGRNIMVNSGIALFLMVGIWSILGYVQSSVGLNNQQLELGSQQAPDINNVVDVNGI